MERKVKLLANQFSVVTRGAALLLLFLSGCAAGLMFYLELARRMEACYSFSTLKLTLSASYYRIIDTVCGSPSRYFDLEME